MCDRSDHGTLGVIIFLLPKSKDQQPKQHVARHMHSRSQCGAEVVAMLGSMVDSAAAAA